MTSNFLGFNVIHQRRWTRKAGRGVEAEDEESKVVSVWCPAEEGWAASQLNVGKADYVRRLV
jgi:hypothetical protein